MAKRYAGLDADGRVAVREFIDQTGDFDTATRSGLRAAYAQGDIDIRTGEKNNIVEEIQTYSGFEGVTDIERTGRSTILRGVVVGQDGGDIEVAGRFYRDGAGYVSDRLRQNANEVEAVFRRNGEGDLYEEYGTDAIKHLDETTDGSAANIRGQLGEEVLQPELGSNKYGRGGFDYDADADAGTLQEGYIPDEDIPYNLDASEQGFDGFAVDGDGNLVIIETKVKSANGRVTNAGVFGDTLSNGEGQMSDVWIRDRLTELAESADTEEQRAFVRRLADDDGPDALDINQRGDVIVVDQVNIENVNKELFVYQDGDQTGELAASGLRQSADAEPTLDRVEVIKIGDVFTGI